MPDESIAALVAFHTQHWVRVAVGSFQRHFPGTKLLVVDNNPARGEAGFEEECAIETEWLHRQEHLIVLRNPSPKKTHGVGLDIAAAWCRESAIPILVLFEPDCLVRGGRWLERLVAAVRGDARMAGYFRKSYGPIHPAPSAWNVDALTASFDTQTREHDEQHPRFHEIFDVVELRRVVDAEGASWDFWGYNWDSTQKNWFEAAVLDQAALLPIEGELDFRHYWCGSTQNRDHRILRDDPELRSYGLDFDRSEGA